MTETPSPVIACDPDGCNPVILAPRGYESMTAEQLSEYITKGTEMIRDLRQAGAITESSNG